MNIPYTGFGKLVPKFIADFDSTTAMLTALSNFLKGDDFPGLGIAPASEWVAKGLDKLSEKTHGTIYAWSGQVEGIPAEDLDRIQSEQITRWIVNNYKKKQYPAITIGSASGAMVHLNAALGIPWLPQTFLIPVQRPSQLDVDEPKKTMEWARDPARVLLDNNPDLQLHHMFDPNQDRIMLENVAYFRLKKLTLGNNYENFLRENLQPGGTIFVHDCQRTWPTTRLGERHIFQFGSLGGANEKDFFEGSEDVKQFLKYYRSRFSSWDAPQPDGETHEAEWGFEPALYKDIEQLANENGFKIKRIVTQEPEHLSPLVAELYRWWYKQRNIHSSRLVIDSFIMMDPWWTLRTGSVPFWMKFNMEPSASFLEEYMKAHAGYEEIFLMLFNHGVDAVGLAPVDRWRYLLSKARKKGEFLGVDPEKIPRDFGSFIRYNLDFQEKIRSRYPIPGPLSLKKFMEFAEGTRDKYQVRIIDYDSRDMMAEKTEKQNQQQKVSEKADKERNLYE